MWSTVTLIVGGLVCAAAIYFTTKAAADGRLEKNGLMGLRIPSTMTSEVAWQAGHAAALPHAIRTAVVMVVACIASVVLLIAKHPDIALAVAVIAFARLIFGVFSMVRDAGFAAREAEEEASGVNP